MQPNLSEYIGALRKFNVGISDTEIKEYLLTVGYKPEELASAFGRIYAEAITKKEAVSSLPKPVVTEVSPVSPLPPVEKSSLDPYRQSILSGDNFSLQTKNIPSVLSTPEVVLKQVGVSQDAPEVVRPIIQETRAYPGMGNFNQNTQYKVPSALGYTNPDWKEPKVKSPWVTLFVWLMVFGFAGGGAYAYMKFVHGIYLFVKPPFSRENFLEDFLSKSEMLQTSNQKVSLQFSVTEVDPDAVIFKRGTEEEEMLAPYKRDEDRLRDVAFLLETLSELYESKKPYPATLAEAGLPVADTKGNTYQYKVVSVNKISTPEIKVTFETPEALDIAKRSGAVTVGTQATFTNSSLYSYVLKEKVEPESLKGLVFFKELENSLKFLSVGTEASLAFTGSYEKGLDTMPENTNASIQVEVKSDMFNFGVDLDIRKIAKDFFLKVNKAPTIFADFSRVKNKWVHITSEKIFHGDLPGLAGVVAPDQKAVEKLLPQIRKLVSILGEEGVVQLVGDISKTTEGRDTLFNYNVTLNKEAFKKFYERAARELSNEYKNESILTYSESALETLRSKEFDGLWDYFFKNTTIYIVANKEGIPLKMEFATRFVPSVGQETKKTSKQVNIKMAIENKDINQVVVVETPKDALSFKDAFILVQGITETEYDFSMQEKNLVAIGSALETYKKMTNRYPDTLEILAMKPGEVRRMAQSDAYFSKEFDTLMPLLPSVLEDAFTKSKFAYKKIPAQGKMAEDFTFSYTMKIPAFASSTVNPFEERGQKIGLIYADGVNNANSKALSIEADKNFLVDTDKDGLTDNFEVYIGTSKVLKDTDKDSFTDLKEFKDGSNPLGPGLNNRSYFYNSSF